VPRILNDGFVTILLAVDRHIPSATDEKEGKPFGKRFKATMGGGNTPHSEDVKDFAVHLYRSDLPRNRL
jgi:hypothetical protein